jgi:hypothetical protein
LLLLLLLLLVLLPALLAAGRINIYGAARNENRCRKKRDYGCH